jgi:phosphoribosyl-ATP pyrophosphohydrolase/phosphoribosyl-AMP cyclohydrolase
MELNFSKYGDGLIPAIVQDADTRVVLMLGFMNQEAFDLTLETHKVTFYSRSRQTLWTKGETSGNFLRFVSAKVDCDNDTLLIQAHPMGPTCHTGTDTCWAEENKPMPCDLRPLEQLIQSKKMKCSNEQINVISNTINALAKSSSEKITDDEKQKLMKQSAEMLYNIIELFSCNGISVEEIIENINKIQTH